MSKTVLFLLFCLVIVNSEGQDSVRVKRAKYHSYPSRFYRKPPPPHVIKGPFSYTPPPSMRDDEPSKPSFRPKVSKKHTNDGLGDEDITNLVKYLSKKDLDKIVEYAVEKDRYADKYRDDDSERDYKPFRRPEKDSYKTEDIEQFAQNIHKFHDPTEYGEPRIVHPTHPTFPDEYPHSNYINDASQTKAVYTNPPRNTNQKIVYTNPYEQDLSNTVPASNPNFNSNTQAQFSSQSMPFSNLNPSFSNQISYNIPPLYPNPQSHILGQPGHQSFSNDMSFNLNNQGPHPGNFQQPFSNNIPQTNTQTFSNNPYSNTQLDTEESMRHYIAYVTVPPNFNVNDNKEIFTDSNSMNEEQLPKPLNLREDEYEGSNTDNVPKVVKSDLYKVESFKDLPLMNYDSKLHTVSSYHVPHYLVTSTKSQSSQPLKPYGPPSVPNVPIESAPPGYTGKEQSDAHLKAVRIWTHRSKGTAYTLHDDGTLSREKPKIQTSYGYAN